MYSFHQPYKASKEIEYVQEVLNSVKTAYGGKFTLAIENDLSKLLNSKCYFTTRISMNTEISVDLIVAKTLDFIKKSI